MNERQIVKRAGGAAASCPPLARAMEGIARWGHFAFVLYGLWLWYSGRDEEAAARRRAACSALFGVLLCSFLSFAIGKMWRRERPFSADETIPNPTGHRANASFPSNHTMNSAVIALVMRRFRMPGWRALTALSALLGLSRITAGVHYPSDILGGAAIAFFMERFVLSRRGVVRLAGRLAAFSLAAERLFRALWKMR